MLRAVGIPLLCLAMVSIAGGHWALLQTVAWAQMLQSEYARGVNLAAAVEKTFSGKHPCSLCHKVQAGQTQEEKAPAIIKLSKKAEGFTSTDYARAPWQLAHTFSYPRWPDIQFDSRRDAPPRPVPRGMVG